MIFKSDDFSKDNWTAKFSSEMSAIANKLFNEWLNKQPVVYGNMYINNKNTGVDVGSIWNISEFYSHTHKARLCMIEPLVQEHECVPLPMSMTLGNDVVCKICGTQLIAKWERVK